MNKRINDGKNNPGANRSTIGPVNNDGKKGHVDQLQNGKLTVKYTLERTKEDIENLKKTKGILEYYFHKMYNTDSQIYRDLPKLTVNLEDKIQDLNHQVDELTAKLEQLEILRTSLCRIFEMCKEG